MTTGNHSRVRLGTSDLSVHPLSLGGNVFGWTADEQQSFAVLDAYAAAGGNFVDTADFYSAWAPGNTGGESETVIGNWLRTRGNRDDIVIATKVGLHPEASGLGAATIKAAAEASLRRLGVAQALIHDPRVLLLDEPTAGLAPEGRARLRSLLAETAVDRLVVLATQRPDDIEAVCARVAVLDGGKLLYLGTARDLVERAQGKVFLAELPEGALAELRRRFRVVSVVEHGRRCVARFLDPEGAPGVGRADRPGLEDAYLLCLNGGVPA